MLSAKPWYSPHGLRTSFTRLGPCFIHSFMSCFFCVKCSTGLVQVLVVAKVGIQNRHHEMCKTTATETPDSEVRPLNPSVYTYIHICIYVYQIISHHIYTAYMYMFSSCYNDMCKYVG